jgi:hypothetical protein
MDIDLWRASELGFGDEYVNGYIDYEIQFNANANLVAGASFTLVWPAGFVLDPRCEVESFNIFPQTGVFLSCVANG